MYQEAGGYLEGHFLLASGRHSPVFLQSLTVLQHPEKADALGAARGQRASRPNPGR
jgi:orotate phosphoribosyltransferase